MSRAGGGGRLTEPGTGTEPGAESLAEAREIDRSGSILPGGSGQPLARRVLEILLDLDLHELIGNRRMHRWLLRDVSTFVDLGST
jgi:hypothetical protein